MATPTNTHSWQPTLSVETAKVKQRLLKNIRLFFEAREVLEVETPILSCATIPDPFIEKFRVSQTAHHKILYLQPSPELPMKRLLCAGFGSIFQICKAFRGNEKGRHHNSEFTLLEWYRLGFDYQQLMLEVEQLIQLLIPSIKSTCKMTYQNIFKAFTGIDPLTANVSNLQQYTSEIIGLPIGLNNDKNSWLNLIMSQCIEPKFDKDKLYFIYDFPASQASLAKIKKHTPVAERFEVYLNGIELANGFTELQDAHEQQQRFKQEQAIYEQNFGYQPDIDQHFLDALQTGLPSCAGVALGIDRLLMILTHATHIRQVLSFPTEYA